ncbi:Deoxyribodipyrimidine photo-lyase [Methylocella silvestris BL2]|uniref:Deoxyribodipyrimidine photo-lyase n=1 Tax=Methylocella silvestris (strain DSM 15510 / CIP 108128 / LMG 27833 / NCIMB 13906 / BL2) TaxID=395965 RepID=B8EQT2_METSB|nr:deoxyribodipyrimidine photo-lyase [Methylocella silvestris]ACK49353.1 Deoxyribodipyrimidine photo-lyase [Methylocella silvestris BL2]
MAAPKTQNTAIVWFRDDLRLADNEALAAALSTGGPLLCVYILEDGTAGFRPLGGAARWWLHHSLQALGQDIAAKGGRLDLFCGEARRILPALAEAAGARIICWTRRYGGPEMAVDAALKAQFKTSGVEAKSFNGHLLHEPWDITRGDGHGFAVYTPYWRAASAAAQVGEPLPAPDRLPAAPIPRGALRTTSIEALALLPEKPDWAGGLRAAWRPGENGAQERLKAFLEGEIASYSLERNRPSADAVSRLSPHLRFGEIGPRQIFAAVRTAWDNAAQKGGVKFLAELGWREFNYHLSFYHPDAARQNIQRRFDKMPWREPAPRELSAWQRGETGYPLIDAGMRELWATGYMHNRVRMVVASFLIKHLLIDWRIGENWFWDTLCDADPANNPMNWQWVAGSGADAAPYFRIFNPVLQGEKFDAAGDYVRRWIPELAKLPNKWIHKPFAAPPALLRGAGVELGKNYPRPIVDLAEGRARALAAFEKVKG